LNATPWKLYSRRELDDIAASLSSRAQAWGKAWLPDVALAFEADCDGATHGMPPLLALHDEKTQSACAVLHAQALPMALLTAAAAAIGASPPSAAAIGGGTSTLRDLMVADALRDLLARLAGLPSGSARRPQLCRDRATASATPARAGASLWLKLRIGHEEVSVWLAHAPGAQRAAAHATSARQALAPRLDALHARRIRLRVVAGETSLPLSELMRLGRGDVVLLDGGIDAAMTLESMAGTRLAQGYLGLQGTQAVLQIDAAAGIDQQGKGQA
jgi:flagellar motor switch/type III secretory pathway protein FliN